MRTLDSSDNDASRAVMVSNSGDRVRQRLSVLEATERTVGDRDTDANSPVHSLGVSGIIGYSPVCPTGARAGSGEPREDSVTSAAKLLDSTGLGSSNPRRLGRRRLDGEPIRRGRRSAVDDLSGVDGPFTCLTRGHNHTDADRMDAPCRYHRNGSLEEHWANKSRPTKVGDAVRNGAAR